MTEPPIVSPSPNLPAAFESMVQIAQRLLSITAVITAIGFVVNTNILLRTTGIFSFAIYPQQYVIWGVFFTLIFLIRFFLPTLVLIAVLIFLVALSYSKWVTGAFQMRKSYTITVAAITVLFTEIRLFWFVLLGAIFLSAFQPETVLNIIPGGQHKTVSLIFQEEIDSDLWHLSVDPSEPRRTQPVLLITEYTDGLLIKDLVTGTIVKIRSDMLVGIIDNLSIMASPTPMPSATP